MRESLLVRAEAGQIPAWLYIKEGQRMLIEGQLKQILKKGEIPIFVGYKLGVKTYDIRE